MKSLTLSVMLFGFLTITGCGGGADPDEGDTSSSSSGGISTSSSSSGSNNSSSDASSSSSSSGAIADCGELRNTFENEILPILSSNACADCHNASGIASGTDFVLNLPAGAEINYQAVYALFNADGKDGASLFVDKPTGREAHLGGDPIAIGSAEELALASFRDDAVAAIGCDAPIQDQNTIELSDFTGDDISRYLRMLAPRVVGRQLLIQELELIEQQGPTALNPILESWLSGPETAETARRFVSVQLNASGKTEDANYDLPGNLAAYLVQNNRPWAELLTADYCVDDSGEQISCDTGAPYNAGVLTTRGYLVNNSSRFNLRRATSLLSVFSCKNYPINEGLEPPVEKPRLIQMFQADNLDEVEDEQAQAGFGNGEACYSCHSQFAWHTQLFSKFDDYGLWRAEASGIQDPDGELGRSFDGLMTSHFVDPAEAASETSQMYGVAVSNLSEAANVIVQNDVYKDCSVRNMVMMTFGVDKSVALAIDASKITKIIDRIFSVSEEPTFQDYLLQILSDLEFVNTFVSHKSVALSDEIFNEIIQPDPVLQPEQPVVDDPADNSLYQTIRSFWRPTIYINANEGTLSASETQTNLASSQWHFMQSPSAGYYNIFNRANPDHFLHIENGEIELSTIAAGWHSAQWELEEVEPGVVRIRNRWQGTQYLHIENGSLESGDILQVWHSARWILDSVN